MARCLASAEIELNRKGHENPSLEVWVIGKTSLVLYDYGDGDGWNVYAPVTDDGRIPETLKAIAERCGVEIEPELGDV
jgi:hypothetical protein